MRIRREAGYGDERRRAEFARLLGIKPPSLHDIESGETKTLNEKTIKGYLKIGANLEYLLTGRGAPMRKQDVERQLKDETLISMLDELDEGDKDAVTDLVKGMIRRKGKPSKQDPFLQDPPKDKKS